MTGRLGAAVGAALTLVLVPCASAAPGDRPMPTDAELAESVQDIEPNIADIELAIQELDSTTTDGDETVIALTTDVLFDFGKSDLPANAPARITEILADVPKGTAIRVEGHTDSIGADDFNQTLSEARAKAVAAAIEGARPDLKLAVRGFGESQPVEPNEVGGEDNPDGRAKNRRVEIRFGD